MPLKVRVRAKIQLTFLDYLLQELVVVRGGVQVYQPSLLVYLNTQNMNRLNDASPECIA